MIDIMDKYILDHKIYIVKSQESESIDMEYNFLKHYKNKKYYYDILKTQNNYQLKSLYDFIYEHSIKCSHLLDKTINQFQGTEKIADRKYRIKKMGDKIPMVYAILAEK